MRAVIQRVSSASVTVGNDIAGKIGPGILVLLGIGRDDGESDADYVLNKTINLRIFEDADGRMNRSLKDTGGGLLVVSQFTLFGDTRKGLRPSFVKAAEPGPAEALYRYFLDAAKDEVTEVASGTFRAMMDVELVNDGPVTILVDSNREF
ncbi:MAG: D-aminoacyl-tRNA deacylase [Acidobacteriota bacterium]|nr:D-aminoacyl-tRNA deacylase [Acidobacteriota bacterium]MDH3528536.1 D-aminoacyl-tRNA deacylase [Acidobacteriota bacterium]